MNARLLLFAVLLIAVAATWVLAWISHRVEHAGAGIRPLDPVVYETLEVVTLGTGGSAENHLRLGPAVAIGEGESLIVVDAGRGVAESLRRAEIPVDQPAVVLLTSLLPENTVGLDDLMLNGALAGREAPLHVYGPRGTEALVAGLVAGHRTGAEAQTEVLGLPPGASSGTATDVGEGFELSLPGLVIAAAEAGGEPLPRLVWSASGSRQRVVVSGAGGDPERTVAFGKGANLWVTGALVGQSLDAALADLPPELADPVRREAAQHLRIEDVGALATRMGVRTLVLTRLRPPPIFEFPVASWDPFKRLVAEDFAGQIALADDGESFTP